MTIWKTGWRCIEEIAASRLTETSVFIVNQNNGKEERSALAARNGRLTSGNFFTLDEAAKAALEVVLRAVRMIDAALKALEGK